MAVLPQATPLLLTKRLNAFLRAHTSPQLPTLLLTTSHGKLLAHSSSAAHQPVAVLRTHATVTASLLAIHTASSAALPAALPASHARTTTTTAYDDLDESDDDGTAHGADDEADTRQPAAAEAAAAGGAIKPVTITVQLSGGTVIIRRLRCGLLFVCIGPTSSSSSSSAAGETATVTTSSSSGPSFTTAGVAGVTQALESADLLGAAAATTSAVGAGETESLGGQTSTTSGEAGSAAASSVMAMRRHAGELARLLDDKLGTLLVPEDRTGAE